ncbi:MgtC/SapB family protein [Patescibacteria group bacterium]|nr:MAG: MgtC/SapB family protein [Patescibacteria group bacterium]
MTDISSLDILIRLVVAASLGAVIGLEREYRHKPAGVRTDILVALGTAVMTIVSVEIARFSDSSSAVDVSRVVSQVLPGIGFIGAGTILQAKGHVEGLTTAASIWLVAGVGMAVGLGLFPLAVMATALGVGSLILLHVVKLPEDGGKDN